MSNDIIQFFLRLRNTVKVYHWATLSYPRHKASDALLGQIDTLSDSFVEIYIGRYGRDTAKDINMLLPCLSEDDVMDYLVEARDWLSNKIPTLLKKNDTELFNIRDEIIGALNQCLYLFTLS